MTARHSNGNHLRSSSTAMMARDANSKPSSKVLLDHGGTPPGGPLQSTNDFRGGDNLLHLKMTAEKLMLEQASTKSDLQNLNAKLQKSEDQTRELESTIQKLSSENATLVVKHKQHMNLWNDLDAKFNAAKTVSDDLANTLLVLDSQLKEAEQSKVLLEKTLDERRIFLEKTKSHLDDLLQEKLAAEVNFRQSEATKMKLQNTIQELERIQVTDSLKIQSISTERDDLKEQLSRTLAAHEESMQIIRSTRFEIDMLHKDRTAIAEDATRLRHLTENLTQEKASLEMRGKDMEDALDKQLKAKEDAQQSLANSARRLEELEKVNAAANDNIEKLLAAKAEIQAQNEQDKFAQLKITDEMKQYLIEVKMDADLIKCQLQEAIQKNEQSQEAMAASEEKFDSLQDNFNCLQQERNDQIQLVQRLSQREALLQHQVEEMQEQLQNAENEAKHLQREYDLELESKLKEQEAHFQKVLRQNTKETDDLKTRLEAETVDAIARERLEGENGLKAAKQAWKNEKANEMEIVLQRCKIASEEHDLEIRKLREDHDEAITKLTNVHSKAILELEDHLCIEKRKGEAEMADMRRKLETEKAKDLEGSNQRWRDMQEEYEQRIRVLREEHEDAMTEMRALHSKELKKLGEDLWTQKKAVEAKLMTVQQTSNDKAKEAEAANQRWKDLREDSDHQIRKLRSDHEEAMIKVGNTNAEILRQLQANLGIEKKKVSEYRQNVESLEKSSAEEIEKLREECKTHLLKSKMNEASLKEEVKKIQVTHMEEIAKIMAANAERCDILERDHHAYVQNLEKLQIMEINEWKLKALQFETQWNEALQNPASEGIRDGKEIQATSNRDHQDFTTTEAAASKSQRTLIGTPVAEDGGPSQQSRSSTHKFIVNISDTTDDDSAKTTMENTKSPKEDVTSRFHNQRSADKLAAHTDQEPLNLEKESHVLNQQETLATKERTASTCTLVKVLGTLASVSQPKFNPLHQKGHEPNECRKKGFTAPFNSSSAKKDLELACQAPKQDQKRRGGQQQNDGKRRKRRSKEEIARESNTIGSGRSKPVRKSKDLSSSTDSRLGTEGLYPYRYYKGVDPYAFG